MNLLFVTFDQWRADCWSGSGNAAISTPNLDAFAADSTVFDNHFTQATPCGPSRACIHTGLYAFNHRSITNGTPLDARHANWAQILRRHGRDPVLFGYTDTSADPRTLSSGDPRLFTYEGVLPGIRPELLLLEDIEPWLDHLEARGYGRHDVASVYDNELGAPAVFKAEDSETAFLADRFLNWLDGADDGWCAHLSFIKPHPPFVAAAPWHDCADPAAIPEPLRAPCVEAEGALHPFVAALLEKPFGTDEQQRLGVGPATFDLETAMKLRRVYLGLVAELDHHFGRILARLRADGTFDDTLIILTSDHGEMLGDHYLIGKTGPFEQAFHIPLMIRHPDKRAGRGRRIEAFTGHVDLMPTILESFAIVPPLQCDGHSLLPFIDGGEPEVWRDGILIQHHFGDLASGWFEQRLGLAFEECSFDVWLDRDFATIFFQKLPTLLFDRKADPGWRHDLFDERPDIAARQLQTMLAHRARHTERRLSSSMLTSKGLIGRFDPLLPQDPESC